METPAIMYDFKIYMEVLWKTQHLSFLNIWNSMAFLYILAKLDDYTLTESCCYTVLSKKKKKITNLDIFLYYLSFLLFSKFLANPMPITTVY